MINNWSFNYNLNNTFLSRLNSAKDLSILYNSKLLFSHNIIFITNEALFILLSLFFIFIERKIIMKFFLPLVCSESKNDQL